MDPIETPSRSQKLFSQIKDSLSGFNPRSYSDIEGQPCSALPAHTFWLTLLKDFIDITNKSVPSYPRTLAEYKSEWRAITKLEEDYEGYSKLFQAAKQNVLWDKTYCDPKKGLVCGGKTCKPCVEESPSGQVSWAFEQGTLHEVCKMITTLDDPNRGIFRRDASPTCPPCPAPQCPSDDEEDPYGDGGGSGRKGSDGGIDTLYGADELRVYRRTHSFNRSGIWYNNSAPEFNSLVKDNVVMGVIIVGAYFVISYAIFCI